MVQRRNVLAGAAGFGVTVALSGDAGGAGTIEDVVFGRLTAEPPGVAGQLALRLASAREDFSATRYRQLAGRLPGMLAQAVAGYDRAGIGERGAAAEVLAGAYGLATQLLLKMEDNGLAFATADRAVQAARNGDDPVVVAECRRLAATVLRRGGHRDAAQAHVLDAAQELRESTGLREGAARSRYGLLLAVASYTAAVRDDRDGAWAMLGEAGSAGFDPVELGVYRISVARMLGDFGAAVEFARKVDPTRIVRPERRARYWQDTALALHGRGKTEAARRIVMAAERDVPEEVRFRGWARVITG